MRYNCVSFVFSFGIMSCFIIRFLNTFGTLLSLFQFLIKLFLIKRLMNSILAGLNDFGSFLPKWVHLNDASFLVIKKSKLLTNSFLFCLLPFLLILSTITLFAFSTLSLIHFDSCVANAAISLLSVSLFIFDSLLLSTASTDFSWCVICW